VLALAKRLGLELVRESPVREAFTFRWAADKPITRETLDGLKAAKAALRIVQPNY